MHLTRQLLKKNKSKTMSSWSKKRQFTYVPNKNRSEPLVVPPAAKKLDPRAGRLQDSDFIDFVGAQSNHKLPGSTGPTKNVEKTSSSQKETYRLCEKPNDTAYEDFPKNPESRILPNWSHVQNFNLKRVRLLSDVPSQAPTNNVNQTATIAYFMQRDNRTADNWALLYAQKLAVKHRCRLMVIAHVEYDKKYDAHATSRYVNFRLGGLKEVQENCEKLNIAFRLLDPDRPCSSQMEELTVEYAIQALVTDFSPLKKFKTKMVKILERQPELPILQVDAHNIVPAWVASNKAEYQPKFLRPKIKSKLGEFLKEIPQVEKHPIGTTVRNNNINWDQVTQKFYANSKIDTSVGDLDWAKPGHQAAQEMMYSFIADRLIMYKDKRNDPNHNAISNLSPWINHGMISAQRVVLEVQKTAKVGHDTKEIRVKYVRAPTVSDAEFDKKSVNITGCIDKFVDEIITWRELSDNFCNYCENFEYDSVDGADSWARSTLTTHENDTRPHVYSLKEFELGLTHDKLWNASQIQMVLEGKMHCFNRMYWAKKILEWADSPREAVEIAAYLNDKYNLDGADPNGYSGIMWAIAGVHDTPFPERQIFGKIRWMTYNGSCKKFNVRQFEEKYGQA